MAFFAVVLGMAGLLLSASFSGSETAYYRIPKLRTKLDAINGDVAARRLLWLVNRPSFFVATILVGNNVANYTVSLATVLFVSALLPHSQGIAVEIASTLLLAPLLFVCGEMFPKYLSLKAPNAILRALLPLLQFCLLLFIPVTLILWLITHMTTRWLGSSREKLNMTLGKQELSSALDEGQETGLIFESQMLMARGVFDVSDQRVHDLAIPVTHWPRVTSDFSVQKVLDLMREHHLTEIPVFENPALSESTPGEPPIGFVRTIDLEMAFRGNIDTKSRPLMLLLHTALPVRSTVEISSRHNLLTAMMLLQTHQTTFACVIGQDRKCIGFIRADQIRDIFLRQNAHEMFFPDTATSDPPTRK